MSIHEEERSFPVKLALIVAACFVAAALLIAAGFAAADFSGVSRGGEVIITDGMSVADAAAELKDMGIIKFPYLLRLTARAEDYDKRIRPGRAQIQEGMSYTQILEALVKNSGDTVTVVIPEGFEVKDIAARLTELVSEEDFYAALGDDYDYRFLDGLPEREVRLEGYLFPATYEFEKGSSAHEIIDAMLKAFDEHFTEEYYSRAEEIGMTVDEVVTLASIIEREAVSDEDRGKISGVFHNRLNINMRLQSCATVQYILKERKPVLSTSDTEIDSPYNTYRYDGLPIGPIASPGEESIKAALYPEDTDALYFVLGPDGKHRFSKTYEEHLKYKNESGQ